MFIFLSQLRGKEGLFPANYCKLLYGDDEDSSYDDEEDSLSWSSEDEKEKKSSENQMYQVCKVCELAQDAALLCRQCGCSLADTPMVRKDEYLRSNLLESIKSASISKLRRVAREEQAAREKQSALEAALSKTRRAVEVEEQTAQDDDEWK